MDQNNPKDIVIFLIILLVIAASFIAGTRYIKGSIAAAQPGSGLLANIASTVTPTSTASSTATSSVVSTSTPSSTTSTSLAAPTATTTAITYSSAGVPPPVVPFVSTPNIPATSSPSSTATSVSTVASVGTPAPSALTLPYQETNFSGDKNWVTTWGNLAVNTSGFLEIETTKGGTGAGVHLENSASWTDYTFSASLDWAGGNNFSISARYHDDGDLVLCNYNEISSGNYVISLEQYTKGRELTLAQSDPFTLSDATARSDMNVFIKVRGVYGWCSLDNYEISNAIGGMGTYLINAPYDGGIGFTMWDSTPNASNLIIKSVTVAEE